MPLDFKELYECWLEFAEDETDFAKSIYRNANRYGEWVDWVASSEAGRLQDNMAIRDAYYCVLRSLDQEASPSLIDAAIERDIADKIDLVLRKAKAVIMGM